ncbi:hypothetical protein KRX19_10385 [Cardiobacteriaceae bacterium TAE3-ERU3]|nr:hypothetical protein [Cardiobacteriaceae bacterium TAE3-ERU3]
MKKYILGLMIACASSCVLAADWQPALLKPVEETAIYSPLTDQTYRIQVAALGEPDAQGYPVLYLLDGDAMMPMALSMAQGLMAGPNASRKGVVLVAVGYPDADPLDLAARARDYTPLSPSNNDPKYGGAEKFHQFFIDTLKPMIAEQYSLNEARQGIYGHSFGGLYALYSLFNYPEDFQYYLISSPSIWWGKEAVLGDEDKLTTAPHGLWLSVGSKEQPRDQNEADSARAKKQASRKMVDNVVDLSSRLKQRFPEQFIDVQVYEGETHGSVIHRALYTGIASWLDAVAPVTKQEAQ